jgi:hypothetical protein
MESNNRVLEIGKDTDFRLIEVDGIEHSDYEISITNNSKSDGGTITSKKIQARAITMNICYVGLEKAQQRKQVISFFNPKNSGKMTINYNGLERIIEYEVEGFKGKLTNIYEELIFTVDLICADPFWKDAVIASEEIVTWTGGMIFPFEFDLAFATKGSPVRNIINQGDIETPIEITFKGPAINPKIVNRSNGEFFRIRRQLSSDDTLIINTEVGSKKVEIVKADGSRENAFNYIDLNSTFLQLEVGNNLFEYNTDGLEPSSVSIKYKNRYLGV